jgi:hypothetical protein
VRQALRGMAIAIIFSFLLGAALAQGRISPIRTFDLSPYGARPELDGDSEITFLDSQTIAVALTHSRINPDWRKLSSCQDGICSTPLKDFVQQYQIPVLVVHLDFGTVDSTFAADDLLLGLARLNESRFVVHVNDGQRHDHYLLYNPKAQLLAEFRAQSASHIVRPSAIEGAAMIISGSNWIRLDPNTFEQLGSEELDKTARILEAGANSRLTLRDKEGMSARLALEFGGRETAEIFESAKASRCYFNTGTVRPGLIFVDTCGERAVFSTQGGRAYKVAVDGELLTCASGDRFVLSNITSTKRDTLLHGLDTERPRNLQIVSVLDSTNGKKITEIRWDPRPQKYGSKISLAPNCRSLAVMRGDRIDIYPLH